MTGIDTSVRDRDAVFAGRIDALYAGGRPYLSLPFAALCVAAALLAGNGPGWLPFVPLALQIAVAMAADRLAAAYKVRDRRGTAIYWARRYVLVSTVAGATWGLGAVIWFVPGSLPVAAFLALAFLGMTAIEFMALSAYRPAYSCHALLSLGSLAVRLLLTDQIFEVTMAALVAAFGAALFLYSGVRVRLLNESIAFKNEKIVDISARMSGAARATDEVQDATVTPPSQQSVLLFTGDTTMDARIAGLLAPFGNTVRVAATLAGAMALAGEAFDVIVVRASDADSLAAAGAKGPVLSLIQRGERAPLAAAQVLHWPATAAELHQAVARALEHGRPTERWDDVAQGAPIDAQVFAALETSVGLTTLLEILHAYVQNAAVLCRALTDACAEERWDDASRVAQDIAGAAGGLGLVAVTAAARGFTQMTRTAEAGHGLPEAAQAVADEQMRTREALVNLYPALAA